MRIGWLTSGRDAAARTLLAEVVRRARRDGLDLDIAVVFCDHARGELAESDALLDLVADLGLQAVTLSSAASRQAWRGASGATDLSATDPGAADPAQREAWRRAYHDEVADLLAPFGVELLVLAGYMLIASPAMCARYAMLNLHPALPGGPQGAWQDVIWRLLATDAGETGAMIHLATPELDRGPVVAWCAFSIVGPHWDDLWTDYRRRRHALGADGVAAAQGERQSLFAEVRRQGELREIPLLYRTVTEFALGHLLVRDGALVGMTATPPLDLTADVDAEAATDAPDASAPRAGGASADTAAATDAGATP
jgi:phosphoribosylglycinamide formyltransferase-1